MNARDKAVIPRTRNGQSVMMGSHRVVPADAIALLSGVNFSAVEKVLTAIHALREFSGTDPSLLVDLSAVPTHRVIPSSDRFAERADATLAVCRNVADTCSDQVDEILCLSDRF